MKNIHNSFGDEDDEATDTLPAKHATKFFDLFKDDLEFVAMKPEDRYDKMVEVYHANTSDEESLLVLQAFRTTKSHYDIKDTPESRMIAKYVMANLKKSGNDKRGSCWICDRSFSNTNELNRHIFVHSKVALLKCSLCSHECRSQGHIYNHKRTMHVNNRGHRSSLSTEDQLMGSENDAAMDEGDSDDISNDMEIWPEEPIKLEPMDDSNDPLN